MDIQDIEIEDQLVNEPEIDVLPDEVLITIFNYLNASEILKTSLVCKKWFHLINDCHIMRKVPIQITNHKVYFVNQVKFLKRNYRKIILDNIDCSTLMLDFASILLHTETLTFYCCTFYNERTLNALLSACKRLRQVRIDSPKLVQPEPSLNLISTPSTNTFTLEVLQIYFRFKKTWSLLKAFQMVPINVKTLKLVLVLEYFTDYNEVECMLRYINQFYQKNLKDLRISLIYKADNDFDKVIEHLTMMDDLKLLAFSSESFNDTLFKAFIEKQVHLKYLKLEKNVTKQQLKLIGANLSELTELELTLNKCFSAASINTLVQRLSKLQKLTLEAKCGIFIELRIPICLQEFILYSHGTFNLTELRLLPTTCVLSNMKRFELGNIIFKNDSLNEVFKSMINLKALRLSDIHQMTGNGLIGRAEETDNCDRYSIERLQNLEMFTSNADVIDDGVLIAMKLPKLKFFNLEGDLEDSKITDEGLRHLAKNCKLLQKIRDESYKAIFGRNLDNQTFFKY